MSAQTDAINAQIAQDALDPIAVTIDNNSVTGRSAADSIALRNDQSARDAVAAGKAAFGLRFSKIVPGGAG